MGRATGTGQAATATLLGRDRWGKAPKPLSQEALAARVDDDGTYTEPHYINPVGVQMWYEDSEATGKDLRLHREGGPALVYPDGSKCWYRKGFKHREDGPAVERANGDREWYVGGGLHREDGPAVEHADGYNAWWTRGGPSRPAIASTETA